MLNKRGDLALTLLVFIILVTIGAIIFGFLGFDSHIQKKAGGLKKLVEEAGFAQQYMTNQAELIGKESIKKGGNVKNNFISLASQRNFGIDNTGNFFRKIKEGDFQFYSDGGGEGHYYLKIENIIIVSREGSNRIERSFDIVIEFDKDLNY